MSAGPNSTRRDPRHALRRGSGFVELPRRPDTWHAQSAALTAISVSGLAFEASAEDRFEVGGKFDDVIVQVGDCRLSGDLFVRSIVAGEGQAVEVGCLFNAGDRCSADRLMALLAGIEATRTEP